MQGYMDTQSNQFQIDLQLMVFRLSVVQTIASGLCDFIAQCIIVRINNCTYHSIYIHLNLQRSTAVGSCGIKIYMS
jgi:hypothetical protein